MNITKFIAIAAIALLAGCDEPPAASTTKIASTGVAISGLPGTVGNYWAYTACMQGVKYYITRVHSGYTMTPFYSRSVTQPTQVNSAPDAC